MITISLTHLMTLTTLLGALAAGSAGDLENEERARFQGVWTMTENVVNGIKASDRQLRSWILVVEGDVYNPGAGERNVEYTFRIDPSRTPKAIDLIPRDGPDRGKVYRGVYAFQDDTLIVSRAIDSEDDRPAGLNSRPGSGLSRVVWKRRKD
jgi:uncharacterized protein (TIGR03067 family)